MLKKSSFIQLQNHCGLCSLPGALSLGKVNSTVSFTSRCSYESSNIASWGRFHKVGRRAQSVAPNFAPVKSFSKSWAQAQSANGQSYLYDLRPTLNLYEIDLQTRLFYSSQSAWSFFLLNGVIVCLPIDSVGSNSQLIFISS